MNMKYFKEFQYLVTYLYYYIPKVIFYVGNKIRYDFLSEGT